MFYFEDVDMKRVYPELMAGKTEIVAVFHKEIILRANEDQQFCHLGNNEQVLKPKSAGRGLMVSEFVCLCHGKMLEIDTGKLCHVILNYGNNYDGY